VHDAKGATKTGPIHRAVQWVTQHYSDVFRSASVLEEGMREIAEVARTLDDLAVADRWMIRDTDLVERGSATPGASLSAVRRNPGLSAMGASALRHSLAKVGGTRARDRSLTFLGAYDPGSAPSRQSRPAPLRAAARRDAGLSRDIAR
jgi:hypothetical protein